MTSTDERFMARALELASIPAHTSPNPRVGAVVVRDGAVIAEGAHRGAGTPHAEAVALEGIEARGATLYVNLEPCDHQGRMPPCAPLMVEAGVVRAVVAVEDPDPRVKGRGIERLRSHGVIVDLGSMGQEAEWINAPFLYQRRTGRSYLSLKLALTIDGRLAAADGSSRWITGSETRRQVHRRRVEADAVMIGSDTVLSDDPSLDAREVDADRQPLAVVVDGRGRVPPSAKVFAAEHVLVVTTDRASHERQTEWKSAGAEVITLASADGRVDLGGLVAELGRRGLIEILCEGGAGLAAALLRNDLVNRLEVHTGPVIAGGGPTIDSLGVRSLSDAPRWALMDTRRSGGDVISVYRKAS